MISWAWRSLPRNASLERVIEVLNRAMLSLENALERVPLRRSGRVVNTDTQLIGTEGLVIADTTAGNVTVTMPDARINVGRVISVYKRVAGNTVTVAGLGTDLVQGVPNVSWATKDEVRTFQSVFDVDGTCWWWRSG